MDDGRIERFVEFGNKNMSYLSFKMWHNVEKVMYLNIEKSEIDGWSLSRLMNNKHVTVMHSIRKLDVNSNELFTLDIVNLGSDSRDDVYDGSYVISHIVDGVISLISFNDGSIVPLVEGMKLKLVGNLAELMGLDKR